MLCFYDGDVLVSEALIPAIEACGATPCWHDTGSQLTYRDRDRVPSGIEQVGVRNGKLKAGGRSLPLPPMPAALPLRVQLQASTGTCLSAEYGALDVRANDGRLLRGKGH